MSAQLLYPRNFLAHAHTHKLLHDTQNGIYLGPGQFLAACITYFEDKEGSPDQTNHERYLSASHGLKTIA